MIHSSVFRPQWSHWILCTLGGLWWSCPFDRWGNRPEEARRIAQGHIESRLEPRFHWPQSYSPALGQWFSNLTVWSPRVLGAGQRQGLGSRMRRPRRRGSVLLSPLHSGLHLYQAGLKKICVANKCFQRTVPQMFLLPWELGSVSSFPRYFSLPATKETCSLLEDILIPRMVPQRNVRALDRVAADLCLLHSDVVKLFTLVSLSVKMRGLA